MINLIILSVSLFKFIEFSNKQFFHNKYWDVAINYVNSKFMQLINKTYLLDYIQWLYKYYLEDYFLKLLQYESLLLFIYILTFLCISFFFFKYLFNTFKIARYGEFTEFDELFWLIMIFVIIPYFSFLSLAWYFIWEFSIFLSREIFHYFLGVSVIFYLLARMIMLEFDKDLKKTKNIEHYIQCFCLSVIIAIIISLVIILCWIYKIYEFFVVLAIILFALFLFILWL